jgi:hypothetical protein
MRAAQDFLGVPTIGGGSARPEGGGGGSQKSQISHPSGMYENGKKTAGLMHLLT